MVRDDPEREEIRAAVEALSERLLGRHVDRGPEIANVLGEMGAAHARDAEVGDLRNALLGEQDVRGLDVAVDDPLRVGGVDPGSDLAQHPGNRFPLDPPLSKQVVEARAGDCSITM
jgi:hypothetical protein